MWSYKKIILANLCYTELVYSRISKKIKLNLSNPEIEEFMLEIIQETSENKFEKLGKYIYIKPKKSNKNNYKFIYK